MPVEHDIPDLGRKELRWFGLTTAAIVAALFGVLFPWLAGLRVPLWPWIMGAALSSLAVAWPSALRPVYRGWMRFGLLASRLTTPIILGAVFYLMIVPMGFLRRTAGRDPMRRKLDPAVRTYRVPSEKSSPERLRRPF